MKRKIATVLMMALSLLCGVARAQECVVRDSVLVVPRNVRELPAYAFKDRRDIREINFEKPSPICVSSSSRLR